MAFSRLRRLRSSETLRDLMSETSLSAKDLIMPYFAAAGSGKKETIESMPGIYRLSAEDLAKDVKAAADSGVKAVLLFGLTGKKDLRGSGAHDEDGAVQKAIRRIKKEVKDIVVITDVCLCAYTLHGHCGILKRTAYEIDNKETLKALAKIALSHAKAGSDLVAPSAMMDGQVAAIRAALDREGFEDVGILAYSAKYASNFYGPFRDALNSAPKFGDRKSYQMDFRNANEALREIKRDIDEGADIVMVKPALAYLDIIYRARENFNVPLAAFNVSGEYTMAKAYCNSPQMEKDLVLEILTAIKRAGADLIITYHAKEAAKWLKKS